MNRRGFLSRLGVAAAAVIGARAFEAPPSVAATGHGPECFCETPGCLGSTQAGRDEIIRMAYEQAYARMGVCADCDRLMAPAPVLPDSFKPSHEMADVARRAVHEKATRDGISHEEAAVAVYWQSFPRIAEIPA